MRLHQPTRRGLLLAAMAAAAPRPGPAQAGKVRFGVRTPLPILSLRDKARLLKRIGFDGIELGNEWTNLPAVEIQTQLEGTGIAVSALVGSIELLNTDAGKRKSGVNLDRIEEMWQATNLHSYRRNSTILNQALCAIDTALWDIKGKRAGMPVYQLLGGKVRDAIALYAHADGADPERLADSVRQQTEAGYQHVRAQLGGYGGGGMIPAGQGNRVEGGYNGPAFDDELFLQNIPKAFAYLRSKLGFSPKLIYDVHEKVSPHLAPEFAKRMEPYQMYFVEDLLPPEQIAWYQQIRQVATTPMAIGELFTHPLEYVPLISGRLIDFARCHMSSIGGITQLKKIANLCENFGVRTAFQQGGEPDPLHQMASFHVEITSPAFGVHEQCRFPALIHEMMPGTAEIKRGYLYGNGTPGLGVDLNEAIAARYPLAAYPLPLDWMTPRMIDGTLVKP